MPKYSKDQRKKIVESYFFRNGSLVAVQRDFVRTFNQQRPSKHCIIAMTSRFRDFCSTANEERSGRPRSVRNAFVIQRVSLSVAADLETSTRQRSS